MKRRIKSCKKFLSLFLAVMMFYSMAFTGITVCAATADANNGDWSAEYLVKKDTSEADLMVRVGDIDRFGLTLSNFDPFSGNSSSHDFPFFPKDSDWQGTDRIMVVSGYKSSYTNIGYNTDQYTRETSRSDKTVYKNSSGKYAISSGYSYSSRYNTRVTDSTDNDNYVRPIDVPYSTYVNNGYFTDNSGNTRYVHDATIQMYVDDFQPGKAKGISNGNVRYIATINGVEIPELSTMINSLDCSGPVARLITFQIPDRYLYLVRTGDLQIKIDDSRSDLTGNDGYAVDFVKLLINRKGFGQTGIINGRVTDSDGGINGATVSLSVNSGVNSVSTTTDSNGYYKLENVPAGQAVVTASAPHHTSQTLIQNVVVNTEYYNLNFTLPKHTSPMTPVITLATPADKGYVKSNTATIVYSTGSQADPTIKQYRINKGDTIGAWTTYNGPFEVTENCTIQAQGINVFVDPVDTEKTEYTPSEIASLLVTNIDTTVDKPVITSPADGTVTNNNKPEISGTAEAGSKVTVYDTDGTTVIGTATAGSDGKWNLIPTNALADGTHKITAKATDAVGNVSAASTAVNVTIDTKVDAPVITSPTDGAVTNNNKPEIIGTAEAGSKVTVYDTDGTTVIGTATAGSDGKWSLIPTNALSDGTHKITAKATDAVGNVSAASTAVNVTIDTKVDAPVITSPTDGAVTNNNKPEISGTAEAGSKVTVYDTDGATVIGTATAGSDGKWSLIPTNALSDGTHKITAKATDAVGNVSAASTAVNVTIDTKVDAPVITSPTDGIVTNKNRPEISGTAEVNSTVNVYDGTTLIGTVTTDGNGHWTLTPATGLSDGTRVITATATDAAGNVSLASDTVNITIDTIKPTLTLSASTTTATNERVTINAETTDSGSGVASIINVTATDGKTEGTFTNPTDSIISNGIVKNSDGTLILDSTITYTVSENGIYKFTAKDNAGNITTQSIDINNITAKVQGTVVNADTDEPISGATVKVKNTNGDTISTSTTDSDGKYILNNITAPASGVQVTIEASKNDYNTRSYTQTLVGKVEAYTQDFSLNPYNLPSISLSQSPDAATYTNGAVTITATGSAGTNSVADIILPGGTKVSGTSAQYEVRSNGVYTFTVEDTEGKRSQATITINNIYAILQGTVIDATTNNPISGATVSANNANGETISTGTTGSDGKYSLNNIIAPASGVQVIITASANDYSTQSSTKTVIGSVNPYSQDFSLINTYAPSIISAHGLYNGSGTNITNDSSSAALGVTNGIPVTLAMVVEVKSSHPEVHLAIDDATKVAEENIVFKKYEIGANGINKDSLQSVSFSKVADINLEGLTMEKDKTYIIVYTITPKENGLVTLTAIADGASNVPVNLNVKDTPDLF